MPKKGLNIVLSMSFFLKKKNIVLQWCDKKCTHCFCCGWSKTQSTQFVIWLLPLPLPKCSSIPPDAVQQHQSGVGVSEKRFAKASLSTRKPSQAQECLTYFITVWIFLKIPRFPMERSLGARSAPAPLLWVTPVVPNPQEGRGSGIAWKTAVRHCPVNPIPASKRCGEGNSALGLNKLLGRRIM